MKVGDNITLTFNSSDYAMENSNGCNIMFMSSSIPDDMLVLGDIFMRHYYFDFDLEGN